jgi:hypothetical protein
MTFQAPSRLLAKLGSTTRRKCANCKHFDLKEGQDGLAKSGVFAQVVSVVQPNQVAGSVRPGEEYVPPARIGGGVGQEGVVAVEVEQLLLVTKAPQKEPPLQKIPRGVKWEDFGSCTHSEHDGLLIWAGDTCPLWG